MVVNWTMNDGRGRRWKDREKEKMGRRRPRACEISCITNDPYSTPGMPVGLEEGRCDAIFWTPLTGVAGSQGAASPYRA